MISRLSIFALASLLSACAGLPGPAQPIQDALDAASRPPEAALPPEVSAALIPPVEVDVPPQAAEPRFDLAVDDIPARAFFMSLVADTAYNMVVSPDVGGSISLHLTAVTVPQVMEVVREAFGYDYRRQGNTFLVQSPAPRTEVFQVNYLDLKRSGNSRTRVSSGQSTESRSGGEQGQTGGTPVVTDQQFSEQSFGTRIETESEAAFWDGLDASLRALIEPGAGRSVVVNRHTGVVVVRALPAELRAVREFLDAVQRSAQRQVILEAKIIEVQLRDGFQAGIDWALLQENARSSLLAMQRRPAEPGVPPGSIYDLIIDQNRFVPFNSDGGLGSNPFGGAFSAAINYHDFSAFVELLETQGRTQVLSSPRVATVNNQKAVIKVGSDEFFVTGVTSQTTTGGAAQSTNRNIILTPFFSGIALDVTPQISEDGDVILHIHPTVSEVVDQTKTFTVGGLSESLPLAFSTVREADSIVRTKSGRIVVIGGMMKDSSAQSDGRIPGVGRIPGLGKLFGHNRRSTQKSELVILLRTTVVENGVEWSDEAADSARRLRAMGLDTP